MGDAHHPSVGRIVHYVLSAELSRGVHAAALVVGYRPEDGALTLRVFVSPSSHEYASEFHVVGPDHDEQEKPPNSWHWPERD